MLKISKSMLVRPTIKKQAEYVSEKAYQTAEKISSDFPEIPHVLIMVNFRMLVSSLERHGILDMEIACDLAYRYFSAGDAIAENPISNRWRQILISRDMTEEAKIKSLSKLLEAAEKRV